LGNVCLIQGILAGQSFITSSYRNKLPHNNKHDRANRPHRPSGGGPGGIKSRQTGQKEVVYQPESLIY